MIIKLPHKFMPRDYQKIIWNVFLKGVCKRFITVWHRRAGKDRIWFNIMVMAAMNKVGMYVYTFPTLTQARRVLWEGRDKDGLRFLDLIPKELIKGNPNNSEMKIELINGSIIRLGGTDQYNSWIGTNPIGVVFSEYAVQNPLAWDLIRPILSENGGWAAFPYTPRGHNHGYEIWKQNKDNEKWFISLLTVDKTFDAQGNRSISKEAIEDERRSGMSDDMIEQEYFCSFEASLKGAYYGRQIKQVYAENRVCDFAINDTFRVNTHWDLGWDDSMSIILTQFNQFTGKYDVIYYYENREEKISFYFNKLEEIGRELGIVYGVHNMPHDGANHSIQTGMTTIEYAKQLGYEVTPIKRIANKQSGIEMCRALLKKCRFHETNCKHLLECLKSYCHKYDEKLDVYSTSPIHNWASHGADSFMTFAQALEETQQTNDTAQKTMYNRVNTGKL